MFLLQNRTQKRFFGFDHDNSYVNNTERFFFPTETGACRELARVGLISKHHYRPQMIHFDVLDDPSWQANIEEKQGCFRLGRYRPFAFKHEIWSITHAIIIGFLMPQIIPGLTLPVKTQNTNFMSSTH